MITIELYMTRKEVMALRNKGYTDKEIGKALDLAPASIPKIIDREMFIDFRISSSSPKKSDDFGALLNLYQPDQRESELRKLVYSRVKNMGYHFSAARLEQLYDAARKDAE